MGRYDEVDDDLQEELVEVGELKQEMLTTLEYGPGNAMTGSQLEQELSDEYEDEQYREAWRQLQEEEKIEQMNGWWYRIDGVGWQ